MSKATPKAEEKKPNVGKRTREQVRDDLDALRGEYADHLSVIEQAKATRNVAHLIPSKGEDLQPADIEGEPDSILFLGYPWANREENLTEITTTKGVLRLTYLGPDLETNCGAYRWDWADDKPEGAEE